MINSVTINSSYNIKLSTEALPLFPCNRNHEEKQHIYLSRTELYTTSYDIDHCRSKFTLTLVPQIKHKIGEERRKKNKIVE